ncbi:MAG: recombinase family protein [Myxococcales bacterium]|nr:recombinase family protein [Myxococcales bacterium]
MSGQRVGYIRVSSLEQNVGRQLEGIQVDRTYEDRVSAKDLQRPNLQAMITYVREGDIVVVHSMDRLARNLDDLRYLVKTITQKGVAVEFIKENITFSGDDTPMANLMLSVMGAFAEFERSLSKERQREGVALAKARGAYKGRKKVLSEDKVEALKRRVNDALETKAKIARDFGISRETLYQYLRLDDSQASL